MVSQRAQKRKETKQIQKEKKNNNIFFDFYVVFFLSYQLELTELNFRFYFVIFVFIFPFSSPIFEFIDVNRWSVGKRQANQWGNIIKTLFSCLSIFWSTSFEGSTKEWETLWKTKKKEENKLIASNYIQ